MEQRFTKSAPSLAMTILDILASPSEAFESIKDSVPSPSLWFIPMLCAFLIFVSHTFILFTDNALKAEFMDSQSNILHNKVKEGKLTKLEADKVETNMNSISDTMIVFTVAGGVIIIPLFYFGCALLLWLANKIIFKSSAVYIKILELFGITTWINILGRIFSIALMLAFSTVAATPSPALAVLGSYNSTNIIHRILTGFNIFAIWEVIVVGIGLGKISGKSSGKGIIVAFIVWILLIGSLILLGLTR
jgi:Yip1 domain